MTSNFNNLGKSEKIVLCQPGGNPIALTNTTHNSENIEYLLSRGFKQMS